jgi:hypothetical protein
MAILFVGYRVSHDAERCGNVLLVSQHEEIVTDGRDEKAVKPGVVIQESQRRHDEANQSDNYSSNERDDRSWIDAARVFIGASAAIERNRVQVGSAYQEVVGNHDACDRTQQC